MGMRERLGPAEKMVWDILESEEKSASVLAFAANCSEQTIRNIKMLETQRAVRVYDLMVRDGLAPNVWRKARRFSPGQIAEIRASSSPSPKLAKRFDCAESTIRMIRTGKTYVQ